MIILLCALPCSLPSLTVTLPKDRRFLLVLVSFVVIQAFGQGKEKKAENSEGAGTGWVTSEKGPLEEFVCDFHQADWGLLVRKT